MVYDEEFTTVDYLSSTTPPPNWLHLVRTAGEYALNDDETPSHTWLHPSSTIDLTSDDDESQSPRPDSHTSSQTSQLHNVTATGNSGEHPAPTQPPSELERRSSLIKQVRFQDEPKSAGEKQQSSRSSPFVQLESLGLRRSPRIAALPLRSASNYIAIAMSAITTVGSLAVDYTKNQMQSTVTDYHDYLQRNIDGTPNQIGPLAQAYLSSTNNNETYTLKQMLQQPDRDQFVEAMKKEVASMFAAGIWRRVPKQEMFDHLKQQREQGVNAKRPQIMMIWSFKRKRNPDGTLSKHKARLCCHGGQQQ